MLAGDKTTFHANDKLALIQVTAAQEAYGMLGWATDKVFQQQETYNNILKTDSAKISAERDVFNRFFTKPQALLKDMKVLQNSSKVRTGQPSPRKMTPRGRRHGTAPVFK